MSYYETNLGRPNTYFRVVRGFDVLELVGHQPSNAWYGASRLYDPVYAKLRVKRGGVILNTHGGVFYANKPGETCRPVTLKANDKGHFEKRYAPDMHVWPIEKLKSISAVPYVHKTN